MAHEELPIPVFSSLDPIYDKGSALEEAQLRFQTLKAKFVDVFGNQPQLFARSLGRVNLIGEHIDYEGYSVLPMAIQQDTIITIRRREAGDAKPVLRIANVNDKYSMCTYPADPNQSGGKEIKMKLVNRSLVAVLMLLAAWEQVGCDVIYLSDQMDREGSLTVECHGLFQLPWGPDVPLGYNSNITITTSFYGSYHPRMGFCRGHFQWEAEAFEFDVYNYPRDHRRCRHHCWMEARLEGLYGRNATSGWDLVARYPIHPLNDRV